MPPREVKLSNYEKLYFQIIYNAQEKLVAAITLYNSKLSFSSAYFLTVIAEEELAKLILLPFAKEAGELRDLLSEKNRYENGYFKHPIKQKIFTSYGLQNRTADQIEKTKQNCLYIGASEDLENTYKVTKPELVADELKHAIKLFMKFVVENSILTVTGNDLSKDFRDIVFAMIKNIFIPCINSELPEIMKDIKIENLALNIVKNKNKDKKEIDYIDFFSNPYLLFDMFKHALGSDYKKFISETKFMSYDDMIKHLKDYL